MASHHRDESPDDGASGNRWRHQESSAYARNHHTVPRQADERGESKDLTDFLRTQRVDHAGSDLTSKPIVVPGHIQNGGGGDYSLEQHDRADGGERLQVKVGPLLNYRRMEKKTWFGSVLVVTRGGGLDPTPVAPELSFHTRAIESNRLGPVQESVATQGGSGRLNYGDRTNGQQSSADQNYQQISQPDTASGSKSSEVRVSGTKLYSDPTNTFWRFDLEVAMQESEVQVSYDISGLSFSGSKTGKHTFFVPALSDSMRIMFHSCNGFSVGTDEEAWSGPCLWNDVLRVHKATPFHVMIGGGDQIYNDGIRVDGPLRKWTDIGNPLKRKEYPFPESLRKECDEYYVNNYIKWYGTEPFSSVNGQIAQLNLWDDHDIIDGFGSYVDDFMRCPVFRGIGGTANKYYLLFQHHLAPPVSTYTTDAPQTTSVSEVKPDPRQLENTFVLEEKAIDSSYIIGSKPGPYVVDHSRSIYARLGARIAFFGIDARTERTRKQVNYPETYEIIFNRLREELGAAKSSNSPIQHLIVLLGIPIAYPRLTWLENIFTSPIVAPIKFLNKRFGFGGGFFNHFDGNIDLLDDLDDHYTARTHKKERLFLVHQLQALSAEFSVRISILGGDVHLAAVGRFYSNPKLKIPVVGDHRYMANIISSAIVNKPPPQAVANLLARRNKIHHLDHSTDETLMNYFDKDPGDANKTSNSNHATMPSRNWAMLTECKGISSHRNGAVNGHDIDEAANGIENPKTNEKLKDGHSWLHKGEVDAGTKHRAANPETHGRDTDGSLDVCIRVEKDQHDSEGRTESYGMTIPKLEYTDAAEHMMRKRDNIPGVMSHADARSERRENARHDI